MTDPLNPLTLGPFWEIKPWERGVSFDQWVYEVQGVRGQYSEGVLWEGMIWSLRGQAFDTVRCMGFGTTIEEILTNLFSKHGNVSTFDSLLQGFYRLKQNKEKRVAAFAMRLEGALGDIWDKHPHWMTSQDAQGYLRDNLFHGLRKPLHYSLCHMYDNSMITYSDLMVSAQK